MAQTAATLAELAQQFDVHPNQITPTSGKGGGAQAGRSAPALDLKALHAKFGELTLENDFLEGALGKAGMLSAKR
jgi:transposase